MKDQKAVDPRITQLNQAMTNWEKPPTVTDLKQDFQEGSQSRTNQISRVDKWLDNLAGTGRAAVNSPKGRSKVVPKVIRKQAEWRYAALSEPFLSTDDLFKTKPATWADVKASQQNQLVLNHQFNTQIDKVKFIDEYVRTAVDEGTVIVKVCWEFEEEPYEEEVPIVEYLVDEAIYPLHEELAMLREKDPAQYYFDLPEELRTAHEMSMEMGKPIRPQITGYEMKTVSRTIRNRPDLEICDVRNITIDPTCKGDMEKCKFVIHSFTSSIADLKKSGKYKNLEAINMANSDPLGDPDHLYKDDANFTFNDEPRKQVIVYEYWGYWDVHGNGTLVPIVAAWVGDVLIRLEETPYPFTGLPFVVVKYLPVRKSNYGEPDGELLEDNQKVIGALMRGMIDIMGRSANGQVGIRKDLLDGVNKRRYESGQNYYFNQIADPRQGVYMHTYPEIPQSAPFLMELQHNEAEALTGVKAFSGGLSGESLGDVATSVKGMLDAASKRETGILRRLANGLVQIGRMITAMNAEFLDDLEVIRITDEDFVPVRKDDLQGKFDLKLGISTAEEDNVKAAEISFMLQTMGQSLDPKLVYKMMANIARLRKMPELAHELENYEPQPDPVQQQLQQLELLKAQTEIEVLLGKVDESKAAAILDRAKAITEQAKARQLSSQADKTDLDFIEQESGVKQERDLQKQGAQARANMHLKQLDHYLKAKLDSKKQKAA